MWLEPLHYTISSLLESTNSWWVNIDKGVLKGVPFLDLKKASEAEAHCLCIGNHMGPSKIKD